MGKSNVCVIAFAAAIDSILLDKPRPNSGVAHNRNVPSLRPLAFQNQPRSFFEIAAVLLRFNHVARFIVKKRIAKKAADLVRKYPNYQWRFLIRIYENTRGPNW
jgi:hypothetical protein